MKKLTIAVRGTIRQWVCVETLKQASEHWCAHRDAFRLGASDMLAGNGNVREGKKLVARVSYNGRVWNPDGSEVQL
jgi:hypothetical protein